MILPNKYVTLKQSIFYSGAMVLKKIDCKSYNLMDLWLAIKKENNVQINYSKFMQTLVYLYAIGAIGYSVEGFVYNESFKN